MYIKALSLCLGALPRGEKQQPRCYTSQVCTSGNTAFPSLTIMYTYIHRVIEICNITCKKVHLYPKEPKVNQPLGAPSSQLGCTARPLVSSRLIQIVTTPFCWDERNSVIETRDLIQTQLPRLVHQILEETLREQPLLQPAVGLQPATCPKNMDIKG